MDIPNFSDLTEHVNLEGDKVKLDARACESDGKNFFTVPKSLQAKVKAQIEADGYIIEEDGTVVKEMPLSEE